MQTMFAYSHGFTKDLFMLEGKSDLRSYHSCIIFVAFCVGWVTFETHLIETFSAPADEDEDEYEDDEEPDSSSSKCATVTQQ